MKEWPVNLILDSELYLFYNDFDKPLPSKRKDIQRQKWKVELERVFPYLLEEENRILPSEKLTITQRWFYGKAYTFKNIRTGTGLQWRDYRIQILPLYFSLYRMDHKITLDEFLQRYCRINNINDKEIVCDWEKVNRLIQVHQPEDFYKRVDIKQPINTFVDVIDHYYDEIKMTQIKPTSYHMLFRWFGLDTIKVGYIVYDAYINTRNGEESWKNTLDEHLDFYKLDTTIKKQILNQKIYPNLEFN